MVIHGVGRLLYAHDPGAESVDSLVSGNPVLVVRSREPAEEQRNRHHVLYAVIAVGRVSQRPFLVDDAEEGFVGAQSDLANVLSGFAEAAEPRTQGHRSLDRGLRVKLGWVTDLEQHILHHVGAVGPLEAERAAAGTKHRRSPTSLRSAQWDSPFRPRSAISARRTARLVASPAAQLLRDPVLGT